MTYDEALRKSGHYVVSGALQRVRTATTVRTRNGKPFLTDGPFAETKEQLGGFILINARNLNEATEVAAKIPPGHFGCITRTGLASPSTWGTRAGYRAAAGSETLAVRRYRFVIRQPSASPLLARCGFERARPKVHSPAPLVPPSSSLAGHFAAPYQAPLFFSA
jgi:hypothetical protein